MDSPQRLRRSVTDTRCGEMNVPTVRLWAHAIEVTVRVVVVLPFVPVTWTVG